MAKPAELVAARPNADRLYRFDKLMEGLPSSRESLIEFYKALRGTIGRFYNISALSDALAAASKQPRCFCALAADIFFELGFVVKAEGGLRVVADPPKRRLEESRTFFALSSLREMNDMYLQLYKEANHEA